MEGVRGRSPNWVRAGCIGKGCFGVVNLAVNKSNGDVFAVKSVARESCLSSQLEALDNEIRILRSISSPYVVGYLGDDVTWEGQGVTTSFRNLHMEYVTGGTVADLARRPGADLVEEFLKSYVWCIVSGLRYVHSKGIAHCDVKGRNILVGSKPGTAKLADFGSAVVIRSDESTAPILPRGSPLWMAPEVVRREYQGPESDVWSLGCTIIEIITGKPAWEDHGADTLCRIGYSDQLPMFPTLLSELGRDFLEKCLRREPSKRWSCDQLLQHPFVSLCSQTKSITHPSPRCVLDWFNSEVSESDDDETSGSTLISNSEAGDRIRNLSSNAGANWESDGWMVVRYSTSDRDETSDVCCHGDEREGTSSVYQNFTRTEAVNHVTIEEYSHSMRTTELTGRANREYIDSTPPISNDAVTGFTRDGAGPLPSSFSYVCGSGDNHRVVGIKEKGNYSCCKLNLVNSFLYPNLSINHIHSPISYYINCVKYSIKIQLCT